MKEWIRNKIHNLIGYPSDIQALLDHLDEFDGEVCIYPGGEFSFGIKIPDKDVEPLVFPTPQERAAFGAGLAHGIRTMGGQATFLTDAQLQEVESMEKQTSVSITQDPKKMN